MSKKNIYILIGAIVVIVIIVSTLILSGKSNPQPNENDGANNTPSETTRPVSEEFSGTVSAVDMGCTYDAVCSVTIDEKKIILSKGGQASPNEDVGKLIGVNSIGEIQDKLGAFANVYAGTTTEGDYTLYGNKDYFVEITEISGK